MRQTKYAVMLSEEERADLRTLIGQGAAAARKLTHARILLKADQGDGGAAWSDAAIAGALEIHAATVGRVRRAYVEQGLDAALERKTPDRVYARRLDGAAVPRRQTDRRSLRHQIADRKDEPVVTDDGAVPRALRA